MIQHKPILADAEMHALISSNPFAPGLSIARLKDFIHQVEKAVIAKQNAEHQPFTPRNAAEMREFIGMHFDSLQYANPDTEEPHEMDRYTLTIHDLLSAFSWSGYYDAGERCVSPTSHKTGCLSENAECDTQDHIPDASKMVPDGWQLVPKEPTEEMADSAHDCESYFDVRSCYKAMLSAAPKYEVTK